MTTMTGYEVLRPEPSDLEVALERVAELNILLDRRKNDLTAQEMQNNYLKKQHLKECELFLKVLVSKNAEILRLEGVVLALTEEG